YLAVHAYGLVEVVENEGELVSILQRTVHFYEHAMPRPWTFDASSTFARRMLAQIVGLRMEIATIQGKWKLNQNHPASRRERVVRVLQQQEHADAQAIAALMQVMLSPDHQPAPARNPLNLT